MDTPGFGDAEKVFTSILPDSVEVSCEPPKQINETFGIVSSEQKREVHPDFTVTMSDNPVSNALQLLILKERC